jgi:hypothetical protein
MVAKCINPHCTTPFHYLRGGKIILLNFRGYRGGREDVHHRWAKYFWLCDSCAQSMTVNLKGLNPEVIPLPNPAGAVEFSLTE